MTTMMMMMMRKAVRKEQSQPAVGSRWIANSQTFTQLVIVIFIVIISVIIIGIIGIIIIIVIKNVVTIYHLNNCANFSFCFPVSYKN